MLVRRVNESLLQLQATPPKSRIHTGLDHTPHVRFAFVSTHARDIISLRMNYRNSFNMVIRRPVRRPVVVSLPQLAKVQGNKTVTVLTCCTNFES